MAMKSRLKYACQTRKASLRIHSRTPEQGTRLLRPRPVLLGVQVSGLAWTVCPTRSLLLDVATILVHLHLSSRRRAWPLPSRSSRWPLQPATCSWRAAARKAPTQESPAWCVLQSRCVREASAGAGRPGAVQVDSVRVRRGPCSLEPEPPPHPPGESHKS